MQNPSLTNEQKLLAWLDRAQKHYTQSKPCEGIKKLMADIDNKIANQTPKP